MIEWIIRRSVATASGDDGGAVSQHLGTRTIIHTPVDALPDLSDVQGDRQNPLSGAGAADRRKPGHRPLTTTMLSVPGAKTVRGFSQLATPTYT